MHTHIPLRSPDEQLMRGRTRARGRPAGVAATVAAAGCKVAANGADIGVWHVW
jgi:hypothetical protein